MIGSYIVPSSTLFAGSIGVRGLRLTANFN